MNLYWNKKVDFFSFHCTRLPFDWKTPYGYLPVFISQSIGPGVAASADVQFLCLIFGSCWLFIFIAEDIAKDLIAFNIIAKTSNANHSELTKRFCDIVQIFTDAKE